jgi:hypothetical protein
MTTAFPVIEMELRIALARRRLFALNVLVPLSLVTPIALGAAPDPHAAAVYAVLFVLFGTFGSAIPLVRDAESRLLARILSTGLSPAAYLLERSAAGSLIDAIQLLPALVVAGTGLGASVERLGAAWMVLTASLWIANLLGVLVASAARSLAETALLSAVSALLLLHLSGVFRTPMPSSVWARLEVASPFRMLHETMLALPGGDPPSGPAVTVAWTLALPALTTVLAGPLARALRAVEGGP